jgi:hypothetical protein
MREPRRLVPLVVVGVGGLLVGGAFGLAQAGGAAKGEVSCRPSWFVPSLRLSVVGRAVQPNIGFTSAWRDGICRVDPRKSFSYRLAAVGADGVTVSSQHGAFSGDMTPGGGVGGGATISLAKWCAHQPVRVTLTGAGPGYARSGKGYRLTLSPISLRCD